MLIFDEPNHGKIRTLRNTSSPHKWKEHVTLPFMKPHNAFLRFLIAFLSLTFLYPLLIDWFLQVIHICTSPFSFFCLNVEDPADKTPQLLPSNELKSNPCNRRHSSQHLHCLFLTHIDLFHKSSNHVQRNTSLLNSIAFCSYLVHFYFPASIPPSFWKSCWLPRFLILKLFYAAMLFINYFTFSIT